MDKFLSPYHDSSESPRGTPPIPKHVEEVQQSDQPNTTISNPKATAQKVRKAGNSIDMAREQDGVNEQSPLLPPRGSEDIEPLPQLESIRSPSDTSSNWAAAAQVDHEQEETRSSWYLFLLTLSISGYVASPPPPHKHISHIPALTTLKSLQIAWSVELSNGSPYLLHLGLSKSLLAFVWIAGPLSGSLVQPYIGLKSDRCRSQFGKRRPFMVGGAVATVISLLALAWAREVVGALLGWLFGVGRGVETVVLVFAVLMVYVVDFSINVIQAGIRAFIVDNAPAHQQDEANAWASRMSGVGNILGYLFGYVDLPGYLPGWGNTQFKALCVLASVAMLSTLAVSCFCIRERDPRLEDTPAASSAGGLAFFKDLYASIYTLPLQIKRICQVQFFAWIGWFPFLFYITTYVGEIYAEPFFRENPDMSPEEIETMWQRATRVGAFALFMFAITSFGASVVLPWVVAKEHELPEFREDRTPLTPTTPRTISTSDYFYDSNAGQEASSILSPKCSRSPLTRLLPPLPSLTIPGLTLRCAWLLSHLLFTTLTILTFLPTTTTTATILVALTGIPWAMTNWAPFALIAAEIRKRDDNQAGAGMVLGIHNIAIAAPQVIATLVSSAIFHALQRPRGSMGDESVAWVLRFGGLCAGVAAWLTGRVSDS